jgi:UDP-3-O-[3-hydroxymyristoyl] glucosamine N-acyltransferase
MILNYHSAEVIHVIGTGLVAEEIQTWLQADSLNPVVIVDHKDFADLPVGSHCVLGFWNINYRQQFLEQCNTQLYQWPIYVHPRAYVVDVYALKPGTVIYPMCNIGYGVGMGSFGLVGPMCQVGHGSRLGSNVVISPGTVIGGSSMIGDHVLFGQHSSVRNKIVIGNQIKFAMNSVITRDITESGEYYGNKRANLQF